MVGKPVKHSQLSLSSHTQAHCTWRSTTNHFRSTVRTTWLQISHETRMIPMNVHPRSGILCGEPEEWRAQNKLSLTVFGANGTNATVPVVCIKSPRCARQVAGDPRMNFWSFVYNLLHPCLSSEPFCCLHWKLFWDVVCQLTEKPLSNNNAKICQRLPSLSLSVFLHVAYIFSMVAILKLSNTPWT